MLGGDVCSLVRRSAEPVDRRDVDDPAEAVGVHVREGGPTRRNGASSIRRRIRRNSAGSNSSIGATFWMPALLTRMSHLEARAGQGSMSRRSTVQAVPPISSASAAAPEASTSATSPFAPRAASARATGSRSRWHRRSPVLSSVQGCPWTASRRRELRASAASTDSSEMPLVSRAKITATTVTGAGQPAR